jgi:hypothetical protein
MDIVELIKREHGKTINGRGEDARAPVWPAEDCLDVHAKIVQDLVYPLLRRQEEMRELIPDLKERNELKKMVGEFDEMAKEDETFVPRLKELRKLVDQHLRTEQRQIFPAIKKVIGGESAFSVLLHANPHWRVHPTGASLAELRRRAKGARRSLISWHRAAARCIMRSTCDEENGRDGVCDDGRWRSALCRRGRRG